MNPEQESNQSGMIDNQNNMRGMMKTNYSDVKWSKERELTNGMSVVQTAENAYQRKIRGIAGGVE